MWMRLAAGVMISAVACSATADEAPTEGAINPLGIYYNQFTGGFSGTEWFQTIPTATPNVYLLTDIFGGGFSAIITAGGQITLSGGAGGGSYSDADNYVIMPNLGGTVFTFDNNRAPMTTTEFPLQLPQGGAIAGDPALGGVYTSLGQSINPMTGAVVGQFTENLNVTITGNSIRFTDPGGLYFQGVFIEPGSAAFRVVVPAPSNALFQGFAGSATNTNLNILGELHYTGGNAFVATILTQTRTALGSQTQMMFRFDAQRLMALPGDFNGDGSVDGNDLASLLASWGQPFSTADLNFDGVVNGSDLATLLANWTG